MASNVRKLAKNFKNIKENKCDTTKVIMFRVQDATTILEKLSEVEFTSKLNSFKGVFVVD